MNRKPRIWLAVVAVACMLAVMLLIDLPGVGAADVRLAGRAKSGKVRLPSSLARPAYAPGEVIVKFKDGVTGPAKNEVKSLAGAAATLANIGEQVSDQTQVLELAPGVQVDEAVARLQASGKVVYAEPNYILRATYTPNDTSYGNQWGLNNTGQTIQGQVGTADADIDAPEAWDLEQGLAVPPTVAVIDTGIDAAHPDLDSKDVTGYNYAGIGQTYVTTYWNFGSGSTTQKFAQSIKGTGQKLTYIGIYLAKAGSPTKSVTVSVRSSLNGSDLASFSISPSSVSSSWKEYYKKLSKSVTLKSGTTYYMVFRTSNSSTSSYYGLADNMASYNYDAYAEGHEYQYKNSSWTSYSGDDFFFETNANANPHDDCGHGTHCSGIIGAETNNSTGVAGVCPGAKIMPVKVLNSSGSGSTSDINSGIKYAADHGAKVISMSLGGTSYAQSMQDAVTYAYNKGVTVLASSGNSYDSTMNYPAGYSHVIGVGATDNQDAIASFSTYNSSVDVSAPGVNVYSTMPTYKVGLNNEDSSITQNYSYLSGTSMACPNAAGLAALVWARSPSRTPAQIEQLMESHADDKGTAGRDDYFGYGRINAFATINNTAATPGIGSLSPTSGYTVSITTIKGAHFGATRGTSYVKFGSTTVSTASYYSSWSDSAVKVKVPYSISKAVSVVVVTSAGTSNAKTFKVKPKILSISPTSAKVGQTVAITGNAYGSPRGTSYVMFGSKKVSAYYSWTNTRIAVKVPSGISGTVTIKVITSGGTSNPKSFLVKK